VRGLCQTEVLDRNKCCCPEGTQKKSSKKERGYGWASNPLCWVRAGKRKKKVSSEKEGEKSERKKREHANLA